MIGITSFGAYIPWHRMDRQLCAKAWGGFAIPGERAVAGYDEDSVTMAVEAAIDCLGHLEPDKLDGLYFATTTSPYKEKQCSALMALALSLRPDVRTADITTSLRSGTSALAMALDSVRAGSLNSVLVAAADSRVAAPAGMLEQSLGDAAGAVLIGNHDVIAEIQSSYTISDELAGNWRSENDTFVRAWEDRMIMDESYSRVMPQAINGLLGKCGLSVKDVTRAVFDPPGDIRRHGRVASDLGFEPSQVTDPSSIFMNVGLPGCAMSLLMLAGALENASPGDTILFAGYGNGADAFLLRVTDDTRGPEQRRGFRKHLASKHMLDNYNSYLRWRDIVPVEAARRSEKGHISVSANWRERRTLLGLWGIKCRRCGTPQYDSGAITTTPIRVCAICQAQDDFDDYSFARKKAKVFSYTQDNLAPAIDPPSSVVMVEYEGGGRSLFDLTDRVPEEVKVGMDVEMAFRKVYFDRGISNYFWKARPIRC
ncbi:MAG: OB-fold domain-containing protein [Dehalococcoidia bacterium]|nr:OB-fold domain-containing protein [Dehalococcoidia bacterium]